MKQFLVVYPIKNPAKEKPKLYKKYGNRIKYVKFNAFQTLAGAEEFAKTKDGAKIKKGGLGKDYYSEL